VTRAFVAVRPPDAVLDAVRDALAARIAGPAGDGVRWTTREQWHVTLQFLGNRADVEAVADALRTVAVRTGELRFGGAGAFPNARRGRVLWLGLREGAEWLTQLAAAVGVLLSSLGHVPEARPYHGHLTLARTKAPTDLRPLVEALGDAPVGSAWTAGEVVVYESRLRRAGAEYEPRAHIPLG
jgi:RNA 2',3'-cyclic 3'-phosphodiesterase